MRAFEITEPGASRLIELPEPSPGPGEALLRVDTVGFCGTDLSTFCGKNPLVSYPRVPGHEVGATIVALGEGVEDEWRLGMDVLVLPYTECGECSACRAGRFNCCRNNQTLGVQRQGAMAELAVVPVRKLMAAEGLSHRELALVEPLTVGAHAVARGGVQRDEVVAVFGAGAIGLGVIASAAYRGARVVAIDIDDAKLALARKCGAAETINSSSEPLHERLQALTDGHGPHVVVEAVGLPATFRAAVEEVCFAGRVVYVGYAKAPVEYDSALFVVKELDVRGSRNALREDFEAVVRMLQAGGVSTDDIVSHRCGLDDASGLLAQWSENPGRFTKIHVRVAGE